MKLRSTTPILKNLSRRGTLLAVAILMVIAVPIVFFGNLVQARDYDAEIQAIQGQIDQYNNEAAKLANEANTLQNEVSRLEKEMAAIQAQIDLSQAEYDKLVADIQATEKKITNNQQALGKTMADMYVDTDISPLEMLASSNNIADYVDKETQRSSVRDSLWKTIAEIKRLKKELEQKKSDTTKVLANQKNARNALDETRSQQASLLAETNGQQAAYEKLSAEKRQEQDRIRQQQQEEIASRFASAGGATVIASGAAPNYPWDNGNCPMVGYYSLQGADGNGGDGYGYGCRQCASYAAWRVARETGVYPVRWGNATNFPAAARASGYSTGSSPRAGALAVMHPRTSGNPEGHVGYVEAVSGNTVIISQYNYNYGAGYGLYSKMSMSASAWDEYIYIK